MCVIIIDDGFAVTTIMSLVYKNTHLHHHLHLYMHDLYMHAAAPPNRYLSPVGSRCLSLISIKPSCNSLQPAQPSTLPLARSATLQSILGPSHLQLAAPYRLLDQPTGVGREHHITTLLKWTPPPPVLMAPGTLTLATILS